MESISTKDAKKKVSETKLKQRKQSVKQTDRKVKVKYFKVFIRRLPPRDYTSEDFAEAISRLNSQLLHHIGEANDESKILQFDHFVNGKISRKRGPLTAAGFITVQEIPGLLKLLELCPSTIPFLTDPQSVQPEILIASYSKCFRMKEVQDKYEGSYESDPEYQKFLEIDQSQREMKRSIADQESIKTITPAINMKDNPLIKYLRLRSLKQKSVDKVAKKQSSGSKDRAKTVKEAISNIPKLLKKSVPSTSAIESSSKSKKKSKELMEKSTHETAKPTDVDTSDDNSNMKEKPSKSSSRGNYSKTNKSGQSIDIMGDSPLANSITFKGTIKRSVSNEEIQPQEGKEQKPLVKKLLERKSSK